MSTGEADANKAYSLVAIPPTAYDKYTLIGKLGHGGMAEVNLAVVQGKGGFRKLTVIKRLHRHLAVEPGFIDMFLDEARLAARLNHPHCVQTYEVGEVEDNHFLAMEYLDGQGLERLLRMSGQQEMPMPSEVSARIISDALDGLAYAHELADFDGSALGVVHRDVSPQNIFITYNGVVKLLDFGIAKAATHIVETKTGVIKGKYAYIAPEQALGQSVDQRSDLWSMGVVLWEVLTGRRLFKSVNELATLHETLQGEIKLPSAFCRDLPTDLDTICMRALQRDPEERYQSAQEMREDLERYLSALPDPPGRKHIARLMKDRFGGVITQHKETLAACLQGTGQVTHSTIERLVPPSTTSSEAGMVTPSFSGVHVNDVGVTPTPTPTPGPIPASVTPPPGALGSPSNQPQPAQADARPGAWIWKAAIVLFVILLALILGLFLPLGDDEDAPSTRIETRQLRDPPNLPAGVIAMPPTTLPVRPQPLAIAPTTGTGPETTTPNPADLDLADQDPVDPEPGGSTEPETESPEPMRLSSRERARIAAARRARREREGREPQVVERVPEPTVEPRPLAQDNGFLSLATTPWTNVSLNGRDLGTTPLMRVELPPGSHTLRLVNREAGIDQTYRVTIQPGQALSRRVGLR